MGKGKKGLKKALLIILAVVIVFGGIFAIRSNQKTNAKLAAEAAELSNARADVEAGIMAPWEYREQFYGEDPDTALEAWQEMYKLKGGAVPVGPGGEEPSGEEPGGEEPGGEEPTTEAPGEVVTEPGGETVTKPGGEVVTKAPGTTAGSSGLNAPVNGSKADIVNFYNKYANATQKYTGKVTITKKDGTACTLDYISLEAARTTAEGMLPNDWADAKPSTKTFTNGKTAEGDNINRMLPPDKEDFVSRLTPAGAKSASCTKVSGGYKVVIKLVSETGNDINFKPKHHSSCMDTLALTSKDLEPFKLNEAKITYTGATITAVINEKGLLTSLVINEPAKVEGRLAWTIFNLIDAKVIGTWHQEITFKY